MKMIIDTNSDSRERISNWVIRFLNLQFHSEKTFYTAFIKDLQNCENQLIIECPFVSRRRANILIPELRKLHKRNVEIHLMTKDPEGEREDDDSTILRRYEELNIDIIRIDNGHHRKVAIIDKRILWIGSLNILSQWQSKEVMMKIENETIAIMAFKFLHWALFI